MSKGNAPVTSKLSYLALPNSGEYQVIKLFLYVMKIWFGVELSQAMKQIHEKIITCYNLKIPLGYERGAS